jgi:UDP-glucose 4-epimerase
MSSSKKLNVLVIGGSGFLGSHVSDELIKRKFNVTIYDRKKSKWILPQQKFVKGEVKNFKRLGECIKKAKYVYNFSGIGDLDYGSQNPLETIKENIYYTAKIVELSIKYKVRRLIYSSTIYVYSDKGSFYKSSKQAAEHYIEEYCKKSDLKFTILRFGSLYGPRSNYNNTLYKIFFNYLRFREVSYSENNRTAREYVNINDAAVSCVDILSKKFENKHIVITGKKKILVKDLLNKFSKLVGYDGKIFFRNLKNPNHYDRNPYTFNPNFGIRYFPKETTSLKKGMADLLSYVKNEIKK